VGAKSEKSAQQVRAQNQLTRSVVTHTERLLSMADEVRKHDKTLGETGQGLMEEEDIWANTPLARSWGERFHVVLHTVEYLRDCRPKLRLRKYAPGTFE